MIDKILTYCKTGNSFCGVENTSINGVEYFYAIILKKKNKELTLEAKYSKNSFEEFKQVLQRKTQVYLSINNDSVLSKRINLSGNEGINTLLNQAFPNINLDDFYYELLNQGNFGFISICRKSEVDKIIEKYKSNNIFITGVSLGNLIVSSISNFINVNTIYSSNAKIQISNNEIEEIVKEKLNDTSIFDINGLETRNDFVLSTAGAINNLVKVTKTLNNLVALKKELLQSYFQSRFSSVFIELGLGSILLVLLINFMFYSYYFNKVNTNDQFAFNNPGSIKNWKVLSSEVDKKQRLLQNLEFDNFSRSSFYINDIMKDLPSSTLLSELRYQPIWGTIKENDKLKFKKNTIEIAGTTASNNDFTSWIRKLEDYNWIVKTKIRDYSAAKNGSANFVLIIDIANDR